VAIASTRDAALRRSGWAAFAGFGLIALVLALLRPQLIADARANGLVADLSDHLIAITTAFVGTDVVLFGVAEGGGDIVVTVQGQRRDQAVRRKDRIAGIWVNDERVTFARAPSYFGIAASGALANIADEATRRRLELGVDMLHLEPLDADGDDEEQLGAFQAALVRNKQRLGLYSESPEPVDFLGSKLFRTTFAFPANVSPGNYRVQVFQFKDGQVIGAQQSILVISKVGLEAEVYDIAHEQAALYGLAAIMIAVAAGWLAGVAFRRS
jgi:uncharacterized protein (TIGR02186 family)